MELGGPPNPQRTTYNVSQRLQSRGLQGFCTCIKALCRRVVCRWVVSYKERRAYRSLMGRVWKLPPFKLPTAIWFLVQSGSSAMVSLPIRSLPAAMSCGGRMVDAQKVQDTSMLSNSQIPTAIIGMVLSRKSLRMTYLDDHDNNNDIAGSSVDDDVFQSANTYIHICVGIPIYLHMYIYIYVHALRGPPDPPQILWCGPWWS